MHSFCSVVLDRRDYDLAFRTQKVTYIFILEWQLPPDISKMVKESNSDLNSQKVSDY